MDVITKTKLRNLFMESRTNKLIALAVALVIIVSGYLLVATHASGFFASVEPDQGTLSANAQIVSDATASGGHAVQFTAPAATPPPPSTGGWPGPSNTGVPVGTVLTAYTGPCTITVANTVIDSKTVNCDLAIHTSGVVIKNSKINGSIGDDETDARSFTLTDSEVSAGPEQHPAVWHTNFTVLRSNIHGGQTAVGCVDLCVVKDSWLHGQVISVKGQHLGGFLSNGGGSVDKPSLIQHNTIVCDSPQMYTGADIASCSGDVNMFGDFAPVSYYTFNNNLIKSSPDLSYCLYGGSSAHVPDGKPFPDADHIVITNNVFEKGTSNGQYGYPDCGWWGVVSGFDPARPGNLWSNNKWDDGTILNP